MVRVRENGCRCQGIGRELELEMQGVVEFES